MLDLFDSFITTFGLYLIEILVVLLVYFIYQYHQQQRINITREIFDFDRQKFTANDHQNASKTDAKVSSNNATNDVKNDAEPDLASTSFDAKHDGNSAERDVVKASTNAELKRQQLRKKAFRKTHRHI